MKLKELSIENFRSITSIKDVKIFIPPIALQNKFAEAVKEIEAQKEKQKQSAKQIGDLFSSLLAGSFVYAQK